MLKQLFGSKPDHPMADPREARRILEQLPAHDPYKALEELSHWQESISAAGGFRLENRMALLFAVDDAAQPRVRKLAKDYFAATRPSRFQENRLWSHCHDYWRQAGMAFARCVDAFAQEAKPSEAARAHLPAVLVRALRGLSQHIKWMHLRYGPVDLAVWGVLNRVFAFAEERALGNASVVAYPSAADSTPRKEFLKAAMFSASSPDSLLPHEVVLAERLIGDLAGGFALGTVPGAELPYWVDLGKSMAPLRAVRTPQVAGGTLRFLGGGAALASLQGLIQKIEGTGQIPEGISLGDTYEPEVALDVMQHLAMYWSPVPPERRYPRHSVKSRLSVVQGFDSVMKVLGPEDPTNFQRPVEEAWIVENVSAGGFGAAVPQVKGDWLKVGALIAMQPEGGNNWVVGMIRRVNRTGGQQARVGIQTLSRAPQAIALTTRNAGSLVGVLLPGSEPGSIETSIAFKPATFAHDMPMQSRRGGREHLYSPITVVEKGDDYEIAKYREMIKES